MAMAEKHRFLDRPEMVDNSQLITVTCFAMLRSLGWRVVGIGGLKKSMSKEMEQNIETREVLV